MTQPLFEVEAQKYLLAADALKEGWYGPNWIPSQKRMPLADAKTLVDSAAVTPGQMPDPDVIRAMGVILYAAFSLGGNGETLALARKAVGLFDGLDPNPFEALAKTLNGRMVDIQPLTRTHNTVHVDVIVTVRALLGAAAAHIPQGTVGPTVRGSHTTISDLRQIVAHRSAGTGNRSL